MKTDDVSSVAVKIIIKANTERRRERIKKLKKSLGNECKGKNEHEAATSGNKQHLT